jgi:hypothetical protein
LLGEQAWCATGLGAPTHIDQVQQHIITLEQQMVELRLQLEERDQDLAAAAPPTANSWLSSTSPGQPDNVRLKRPAQLGLPRIVEASSEAASGWIAAIFS